MHLSNFKRKLASVLSPSLEMSQSLTRSEIDVAIAKYGSTLQLHPDEKYVNCSVEWMLSYSILIDTKDKINNIIHPSPEQLPQGLLKAHDTT